VIGLCELGVADFLSICITVSSKHSSMVKFPAMMVPFQSGSSAIVSLESVTVTTSNGVTSLCVKFPSPVASSMGHCIVVGVDVVVVVVVGGGFRDIYCRHFSYNSNRTSRINLTGSQGEMSILVVALIGWNEVHINSSLIGVVFHPNSS
jgi:hypothetical protein